MSQGTSPGVQPRPSRVDRRWALIALVLVVVGIGVLVGVSLLRGTGGASPSSSPGIGSPYAQLFAQIGPNGEVTKEMALEAFALAIAPLPGVTPPAGDPPQLYEQMDGTFAINWILPYLDQITPDQKASVEAALKPDPNTPVITPGLSASAIGLMFANRLIGAGQDADLQTYINSVSSATKDIAGKLGRSLHVGWSVTINTEQLQGDHALAYDAPVLDAFGDLSQCEIHVNPLLTKQTDAAEVSASMAHEIFHCFQFDWFDQHGGLRQVPDWMEEGQAEWAGEMVGGPSGTGAGWWAEYLTISRQLFSRTYDAVGFYQHMAEEGLDPWTHFDAMLASTTALDAFKVTGATADNFLDTWSSGLFRDQSLGTPWYASGPWNISAHAPAQEVDLGIGDTKQVATDILYNRDVKLVSSADIVEVRMQGHVRMRTDPDGDELQTAQRWLCTEALGCKCPPGQRYSGPELEIVSATVQFGLTGALTGASGMLRGHSTDEYCKPLPSVQPRNPCRTDCPDSNGDPHLRTTNDYRYDFQGAGEFVLLRNPDDSIEVQAREEPVTDALFPGVAINTAVATRDNGHRVGVYAGDSGLSVRIDGQPKDASATTDLGSAANVHPVAKGVEIDFPDGSILWALSVGRQWGINARVQPSDALRASGVGLLGPITPGNLGVPALPDGTQLPAAPDFDARHVAVYGPFADAWRATDQSTLFDYDPGKSTASYTDRAFPTDAQDHALASFSPDAQQAADDACAQVTDPELQPECVFDVAATGDAGFAQGYATQQDLYDSGIAPPTPSATGVSGAVRVADVQDLAGETIGTDDTLYVSIDVASGAASILSVDPGTGTVLHKVDEPRTTDLHFAAGSLWGDGLATDANGGHCTTTRLDPATLTVQATLNIPCDAHIVSMGDAVWFVDTTKADPNTGAGTALTQIDPTTNAPGKSVPLPQADGCCQDSQGAIFCYCGNSDMWRLTDADSAFVDLGNYAAIFPAGTGFWSEQGFNAVFVDSPSGPSQTVSLGGGRLVGGLASGAFLQGEPPTQALFWQPASGSPAIQLATPPSYGSGINETGLDYGRAFPAFATPQGFLHLWQFRDQPTNPLALWLQWAPLPQ